MPRKRDKSVVYLLQPLLVWSLPYSSISYSASAHFKGSSIMTIIGRMQELLSNVLNNISFARIIYSLILLALILAIGREMMSVWDRGRIFLSDFSYFDGGSKKA